MRFVSNVMQGGSNSPQLRKTYRNLRSIDSDTEICDSIAHLTITKANTECARSAGPEHLQSLDIRTPMA